MVWHISALPRMKKLPRLERLLAKAPKVKQQTVKQQKEIVEMWNMILGGTVKKRAK